MAADRSRLFFAIRPDSGARAKFADAARSVAGPHRGRPVRPENIHVTLAFLGDVAAGRRAAAVAAAGRLSFEPFELTFDRIEFRARQRIAWAAASRVPEGLAMLASALHEELVADGFDLEARAFLPHLTLVRDLDGRRDPQPFEPVAFAVREFVLMSSELTPSGPVYRVEERFPAGAGATGGEATRP